MFLLRFLQRGLGSAEDPSEMGEEPATNKKRKSHDLDECDDSDGKQGTQSPRLTWKKEEPLIRKTSNSDGDHDVDVESNLTDCNKSCFQQKNDDGWDVQELVSKDGQARLKAKVLFASFDQRSKYAGGKTACAPIATVIADWLISNQDSIPKLHQFHGLLHQFDGLIVDGSLEWRRLCADETYKNSYQDNLFDLETVLKADIRPLTILPDKSFTGVFSPEKFKNLDGFMSFEDIWSQISKAGDDDDQKIYIVSWNEHFFVLKVDSDACYIIDSLGEGLFKGCNQAYILKFDDSSLMMAEKGVDTKISACLKIFCPVYTKGNDKDEQENEEIICVGKECCGEFIKRFFAAITLKDLEKQEKRGTVSILTLLQKLQIDIHYCSSSFSSSSPQSSTSSLFSDE